MLSLLCNAKQKSHELVVCVDRKISSTVLLRTIVLLCLLYYCFQLPDEQYRYSHLSNELHVRFLSSLCLFSSIVRMELLLPADSNPEEVTAVEFTGVDVCALMFKKESILLSLSVLFEPSIDFGNGNTLLALLHWRDSVFNLNYTHQRCPEYQDFDCLCVNRRNTQITKMHVAKDITRSEVVKIQGFRRVHLARGKWSWGFLAILSIADISSDAHEFYVEWSCARRQEGHSPLHGTAFFTWSFTDLGSTGVAIEFSWSMHIQKRPRIDSYSTRNNEYGLRVWHEKRRVVQKIQPKFSIPHARKFSTIILAPNSYGKTAFESRLSLLRFLYRAYETPITIRSLQSLPG